MKAFWEWLSGKKRTIALIYWSIVVPAMAVIWPMGAPGAVSKTVTIVGLIMSALGLGHAAAKKYFPGKEEDSEETTEDTSTPPLPDKIEPTPKVPE
jgi:hypothetical protein